MASSQSKVIFVVLNWNGLEDTLNCLGSLLKTNHPSFSIVVVDNHSDDDSIEGIRAWVKEKSNNTDFPAISFHEMDKAQSQHKTGLNTDDISGETPLVLIRNDENEGFARGNNVGIRYALSQQPQYVFVLNNDSEVEPTCVSQMVQFAESHPQVGLMGPKILDFDTDIYRQYPVRRPLTFISILLTLSPIRRLFSWLRIYNQWFYYFSNAPQQMYALPGSALFFRADTINAINCFDESTFLYWEEFIIAEKLRKLSIPTYIVPQAIIRHKVNASIQKIGAFKFIENLKSERYFYREYLRFGSLKRGLLTAARLASYLARVPLDKSYRQNLPVFLKTFLSGHRQWP